MKTDHRNPWRAGVVLLAALVSVAPAAVHGHGDHPQAAKRTAQCSKAGEQTGRIARHTAGYALQRYELDRLVADHDKDRAGKQMNHFLRWKLGGAVAVCGQYITAGFGHFERAYSDEAAAMMLGILQFGRQEPELTLPDWVIAYLNFEYDMATIGGTAMVLEELGLPDHYINRVRRLIYEQLLQPVFDAVVNVSAYLPKGFDIDNRFVREAIAARLYANQGTDVLRRDWESGASTRQRSAGAIRAGTGDVRRGGSLAGPVVAGPGDTGAPGSPSRPVSGRTVPDLPTDRDPGRTLPDLLTDRIPGGTTPDVPARDPVPGGTAPGGTAGAICPGNQIRRDDGSCGCLPDEVLEGDRCLIGTPPSYEPPPAPGYETPPRYGDAPGYPAPPRPDAESPNHRSDEMPLEGDVPWYEQ